MSTDSIQVCIPTAPCRTEARQQRRRLDTLSGKIVGFVDNSKPNFNFLVEDMASLLVTRYGVKSTIVRRKPSAAYAASESVLHDLVAQCDVVVSGSGDWGSCTSWSVHDSVEAVKRGVAAVQVCSTPFVTMGRTQARALGYAELPIAVVPHPFGSHTRGELGAVAEQCVADIVRLVCEPEAADSNLPVVAQRAVTMEVADDADAVNRLFREQRWTDGLPVVAPTTRRVELMLRCTHRARDEVIATIPPFFGTATVEHIAINAVMAGCDPEYLSALIAAVEAVSAPEFNLQAVQTTTHPVSVFLIVNGPIVNRLGMNSGINCLGQGNWANATLGRALRLILQNIGGAIPGEMDLATQGQPGKYLFCCAENEEQNPWEPLHVERGLRPEQSAVTVIGAEGTQNVNTHAKTADEVLHVFAETLARPSSNDYWYGGNPWLMFGPEHAAILKAGGLDKAEVKRRLWTQSKLPASKLTARDFGRMQTARHTELGAITRDTLVPICPRPEDLGIIVAGGPGTHSVNISTFGNTRSVTREVVWAG